MKASSSLSGGAGDVGGRRGWRHLAPDEARRAVHDDAGEEQRSALTQTVRACAGVS